MSANPKRRPAVSGTFYSDDPVGLRLQAEECLGSPNPSLQRIVAGVVPHAGLIYSGGVAGKLYSSCELPSRLIILCPNHTGLGSRASIVASGSWQTPLGATEIDAELAGELLRESSLLIEDSAAHAREHSIEVQLPLLQLRLGSFRFVPICLALSSVEACRKLGEAIARAVSRHNGEVVILSSSDLNHYAPHEVTLKKDARVIEAMLELDGEKLWQRVREEQISMCGYIPTTTTLFAARALGATRAELLEHITSGDRNGDHSSVVGYCAITIS